MGTGYAWACLGSEVAWAKVTHFQAQTLWLEVMRGAWSWKRQASTCFPVRNCIRGFFLRHMGAYSAYRCEVYTSFCECRIHLRDFWAESLYSLEFSILSQLRKPNLAGSLTNHFDVSRSWDASRLVMSILSTFRSSNTFSTMHRESTLRKSSWGNLRPFSGFF